MAHLRYQRHFMALLLGLWLPVAASANDADMIPDHWQAAHCPDHVPEGKDPYFEMRGAHIDALMSGGGGLLGQEELDANEIYQNRYAWCRRMVVSQPAIAKTAYRSRDVLQGDSVVGATQEGIAMHSLPAVLETSKEIYGASAAVYAMLTEVLTAAYTEEIAYMESEASKRILGKEYFCECMKIPTAEFEKLSAAIR